jgi:DNA invertase Pin-like site-specific DNA recombinase
VGLKKADGYIRVVTDERYAIDEQKRNIENAAFYAGYELKDCYIDTGSGAGLGRSGVKKLLDDAEGNKIDSVFVSSMDVLSTDESNTSELLETLSKHNVSVYSVSDRKFIQ